MKLCLSFAAALVPLFALSCSSSSSGAAAPSFDDLYASTTPSGDTTQVFGIWGTTANQQGYDIEQRLSLSATAVRLAQRCKAPDGTFDTVGVSSPATITADHASVKEAHKDQKQVEQALCVVQISAGEGAISLNGGKLTFANLTFDTKYSDTP